MVIRAYKLLSRAIILHMTYQGIQPDSTIREKVEMSVATMDEAEFKRTWRHKQLRPFIIQAGQEMCHDA